MQSMSKKLVRLIFDGEEYGILEYYVKNYHVIKPVTDKRK